MHQRTGLDRPPIVLTFLVGTVFCAATWSQAAPPSKPNVLIIYTDDQGFGDVSYLNRDAKFKTPNLDRLAKEGIAFTNGHSSDSVCTPSRYGLLTGRYAWRTHLKRGVFGAEKECLIKDGRMTLASMLKAAGYDTAMVGKWHLGMDFPGTHGERDWTKPTLNMPLDHGFDYFYGVPASLNFGVLAWFNGRNVITPPTRFTGKKPNARHVDYRIMPPYNDQPKPGFSLEVADDFIDNQCLTRFTDQAIEWMRSRQTEDPKPFFLYLPYTSPHYPVCPLPKFHGQGNAGGYGEFVIETDYHVGRILDFLDKQNLADETLVVFTSDNGPEKSWEQRIKSFQHDSRGGFRGGKRSIYEGGHRVPFLLRWPAGIRQPGRKVDSPIGQVDLFATLADILEIAIPDDAAEDSQSFAAIFGDPDVRLARRPLINHGNGTGPFQYSVTSGSWKLVLGEEESEHRLFNLKVDRTESQNLAGQHPEKVRELVDSINNIILDGRTTEGVSQPNDTGYWKELVWISPEKYQDEVSVELAK